MLHLVNIFMLLLCLDNIALHIAKWQLRHFPMECGATQ